MKKTLNKFLKFLGFNVVKAKRPRARKLTPEKIVGLLAESAPARNEKNKKILAKYAEGRPPYTAEELEACCRDHVAVGYQAGTFPAQKDNVCVGTHNTGFGKESFAEITPTSPNNDNNVTGPTS